MTSTQAPPRGGYQQRVGNQQRQQAPDQSAALKERLQAALPSLIRLAGEHGEQWAARIVSAALKTYRGGDERIRRASIDSWVPACEQIAGWKLDPDPSLGLVYFESRWSKSEGSTLVSAKLGYRGLLELVNRSEKISQIFAGVVYANDAREPDLGSHPRITHKPARGDRGEPVAAYSVAFRKGCEIPSIEWMDVAEIEKCRAKSQSSGGVWQEWWGEMARKTVLKRHIKTLPVSATAMNAALADDEEEAGPSYNGYAPEPGPQHDQQPDAGDDQDPYDDQGAAPPAVPPRASKPAQALDAKALRARARELYAQVRSSGPDVIDAILQKIGLKQITELATADAQTIQAFNDACEQVSRI